MYLNKIYMRILNNAYVLSAMIFVFSFCYIFFFSQCVPFFFDDHEFHRDYVQTPIKEILLQFVRLNMGAVGDGPRPVFGLLFKSLFAFFGFDYCAHRIAKGFIFSIFITTLFFLGKKLFKTNEHATLVTIVIMTLFPIFIQTFGYNGPHIIAELFKILIVIFFLKDMVFSKSKYRNQILVFIFALLAVRSYAPAYSIAVILPLFTIFYDWKKIRRYAVLFGLILLIQFPVTLNFSAGGGGAFGAKLVNIKHVFLNDFWNNVSNPIPSYGSLYYKSFTGIITFFGFWLIFIIVLGLIFLWLRKRHFFEDSAEKKVFFLTLAWMFAELPAYIFLPEHAIRYIMPFLIPFVFFVAFFVIKWAAFLSEQYSFMGHIFVFIMIGGVILTNVSYVYAFRAGWGSAFIGFEKGMNFFSEQYAEESREIGVIYYATSAATEYKFVNKSSENYEFAKGITYVHSGDVADFSEERLYNFSQKFPSLFVVKRVTSVQKTGYPNVELENISYLREMVVFEGYDDKILFDRIHKKLADLFSISYIPNKIFIYKYEKNNS